MITGFLILTAMTFAELRWFGLAGESKAQYAYATSPKSRPRNGQGNRLPGGY